MNDLRTVWNAVVGFVSRDRNALVVGGLAVTVFTLVLVVRRAVRGGRPDTWLTVVSMLLGFAWSAEAMWEIATGTLHLSAYFAAPAFIVFESMLAVAMLRAERSQRLRQHPGRYGRSAWLIAVIMAVVASLSGDTLVESVLRFAVPLLVTKQWWDGMTGDGVTRPADAITWTWTPRRILVRLGLARPGEQDLQTIDRERHVRTIAVVSHRLHSTSLGWRRSWCHARLRRLAMRADDAMLDAARSRVERVWQAAERTRPVDPADRTLAAEAEAARVEAEAAREAAAEATTHAQHAAEEAEAEAGRRAVAEAEAEALRKRLEAEAAGRARAEAEAEAARAHVREADLRLSRLQGQREAAAAESQRRVAAAETAAAELGQALREQERRRTEAEAMAAATEKATAREFRRRQQAEADTRRTTEANTALEAQLAEVRERLAEAERRGRRRSRRTSSPAGEPLMFDGAPVPPVPGVGAATVLAVLEARRAHPDATQKELAERVQVSDRTIRLVFATVQDLVGVAASGEGSQEV